MKIQLAILDDADGQLEVSAVAFADDAHTALDRFRVKQDRYKSVADLLVAILAGDMGPIPAILHLEPPASVVAERTKVLPPPPPPPEVVETAPDLANLPNP